MPLRAAPRWSGALEPADSETTGVDKMDGEVPFIATHCVGATRACTRRERGRLQLGVAIEQACSHVQQGAAVTPQWQRPCVEATRRAFVRMPLARR
jgi:hypothetical protein